VRPGCRARAPQRVLRRLTARSRNVRGFFAPRGQAVNGMTDSLFQILPTSPGAHSVAVDPVTGDTFMPFGGIAGNPTCPAGCIAVFAAPEPGSLPILVVGLAGLIGLAVRRRFV
jgi:hypothetical protein